MSFKSHLAGDDAGRSTWVRTRGGLGPGQTGVEGDDSRISWCPAHPGKMLLAHRLHAGGVRRG
jgi:hypothetical protein